MRLLLPPLIFLLFIAALINAAPVSLTNNTSNSTTSNSTTSNPTTSASNSTTFPSNSTTSSSNSTTSTSNSTISPSNSTASPSNSTADPYSHCAKNNTLTPENWKCYEVDKFLESWWAEHGKDCNNQPFFSCFANFYQFTYFPCDAIGTCQPGQLQKWHYSVQSFYVIVAMANLNQYFTNIYNALSATSILVNEMLPNMVTTMSPVVGGTKLKYREIINMVQSIIGALPNPAGAFMGYFWGSVVSFPIGGLGAWSTYRGYITNNQWVDFTKLTSDVATLTSDHQHLTSMNLRNALSDFTNFTSYVANGTYLYGNYVGRNTSMDDFQSMFKQYITDKLMNLMMRSRNMYIIVAHDHPDQAPPGQWDSRLHTRWTDPNTQLVEKPNFKGKYPVFTLSDQCPPPDHYKFMVEYLFTNTNNMTTPERVFEISYKCQMATGLQGGGFNGWNTQDCVFNLPICFQNNGDVEHTGNQFANCVNECGRWTR